MNKGQINTEETRKGQINTWQMNRGQINTEETRKGQINTSEILYNKLIFTFLITDSDLCCWSKSKIIQYKWTLEKLIEDK